MAEWLKAADCKSARVAYVGSNPTPTTTVTKVQRRRTFKYWQCHCTDVAMRLGTVKLFLGHLFCSPAR